MSSATRPITAEIATLLLSLPTDDEHELLGTLGRAIPNVYVALGRPVEPPGSLRQEEVKASRRGIIIEMLADAVKAGRDASLGPAKLSNFLEVHRLLLARTADAADAGRPLTKDDANRLFDELMSAHTVSSPAEHAASIVVASAREGVAAGSAPAATATALAIADGAPAQHTGVVAAESQFSLIELGALARCVFSARDCRFQQRSRQRASI